MHLLALSLLFQCRETAGMFSTMNEALALIKYYDEGKIEGLSVDFGKSGAYYSSAQGENWWGYYLEPLTLGDPQNPQKICGDLPNTRRREIEWYTTPQEAHELIEKYLRFRPELLEKARQFQETHFKNRYVIGVHYRGTDKMKSEASTLHYHELLQELFKITRPLRGTDYLLYIATDEQNCLEFLSSFFPGRTCAIDAIRSPKNTPPPHLTPSNAPYQCGEDALLECLLLSRTNLLLRTSSNLSLWATYLNPNLPVIELNKRIDDEKPAD